MQIAVKGTCMTESDRHGPDLQSWGRFVPVVGLKRLTESFHGGLSLLNLKAGIFVTF